MALNNKNNIQTFHHLKYYPQNTLDDKSLRFFQSLDVPKEIALHYFIDRLNFFLAVTEQNIKFSTLNKKKLITNILDGFYSFMFSKNNPFNFSVTNQGRYNKVFCAIEKSLNIKLSRVCSFDYSLLLEEKMAYFNGWFVEKDKTKLFINFVDFYNVFGKKVSDEYFAKIKMFILNKSIKSFRNQLINILLTHLSTKRELSFTHDEMVALMRDFFIGHQEKNNQIDCLKSDWNSFVYLVHYLFPLDNHEQYFLSQPSRNDAHIKTKNGKQYKTKLITEIPLEIFDNEAFDILFKKINQDVELVSQWADFTIDYHYRRFLEVKEEFKVKPEYYNKSIVDIAMLKFGKYDRINQAQVYDKDSYLNRNVLFAIGVKLIMNHPEITDSFINNCLYLDEKDNIVGINTTDQGTYLIGYKLRRGNSLAQQKILLNEESKRLVSILLDMSSDIRKSLKEDKNNLYRMLFISASVNNLVVSGLPESKFAHNREPFTHIINYLQEHQNISYEDSVHLARNTSLTKVRASRGVQIYFETQSTTKMAKALGHVKYDPQLLSRYLPSPILDFFQRRWILLFQKGIICEAMKNSDFLLKASNFKNMEQLNKFLENHTLKNIPNVEKQDPATQPNDLKVYISVDEDKIAALLSIGKAIENSKEMNRVSSKAIYWKQLGEEIVKEINNNHSYSQYRSIVANAKGKVVADLFERVIYE